MAQDFEITRTHGQTKGSYTLSDARGSGEVTYSILSPHTIIADHTAVDDSQRGTGAGAALVARMVADARVEGVKIIPLCPFVNAQRARHPDWADAFRV